jgi:hypothetical protein
VPRRGGPDRAADARGSWLLEAQTSGPAARAISSARSNEVWAFAASRSGADPNLSDASRVSAATRQRTRVFRLNRNYEKADHRSSIRVAVSTPTRLPVIRATMSATLRRCTGVRPAWVVPSVRITSLLPLPSLTIGLGAAVPDERPSACDSRRASWRRLSHRNIIAAHGRGRAPRRLPPPPKCSVGPADLGCAVNLFAVRIEDTHRDGARRPIRVDDKRDRARDASCVGAPFPKDVGRTVKELDSVLHVPSSRRSVATPEHPRDRYRTPTPLVPHPRRSATTKLEALDSGKRVQPDDPRDRSGGLSNFAVSDTVSATVQTEGLRSAASAFSN